MLNHVKRTIFNQLWKNYSVHVKEIESIQYYMKEQFQETFIQDHFALIDLPGPHTGIEVLTCLFSYLGYEKRGQGYLAEKQNNFRWLSEAIKQDTLAINALPQIVVADFRREALSPKILEIIDYYAGFAPALEVNQLKFLHQRTVQQDENAADQLSHFILNYLQTRDWPLPTVKEYEIVKSQNELLAWVLVMGRHVNHFAWSIHLSKKFRHLSHFNDILNSQLMISLNQKGGVIKGNRTKGIEQSSTQASIRPVELADGQINLADRFIEFVWRFPKKAGDNRFWDDYFTGFVADNARHVVESLYLLSES